MTEWRPLWDVNRENRFASKSKVNIPSPAKNQDIAKSCCDFVGSLIYPICEGRYCLADNTFCPPRIFENPKMWETAQLASKS